MEDHGRPQIRHSHSDRQATTKNLPNEYQTPDSRATLLDNFGTAPACNVKFDSVNEGNSRVFLVPFVIQTYRGVTSRTPISKKSDIPL